MTEINTEKLIIAVKNHPAIYDRSDPMYSMKKFKMKTWTSVCEEIFPDWESKSATEKTELELEAQKRWKNLRTCLARELKLQKKEKHKAAHNLPVKPRKRYGNYELLTFLLNSNSLEDSDGFQASSDDEGIDPLDRFKLEAHYEDVEDEPKAKVKRHSVLMEDYQAPMFNENSEESYSGHRLKSSGIKETRRDEDEDRQFMLSLVPCFRRLNAKQKFDARIEILQVLKNISCQEDEN